MRSGFKIREHLLPRTAVLLALGASSAGCEVVSGLDKLGKIDTSHCGTPNGGTSLQSSGLNFKSDFPEKLNSSGQLSGTLTVQNGSSSIVVRQAPAKLDLFGQPSCEGVTISDTNPGNIIVQATTTENGAATVFFSKHVDDQSPICIGAFAEDAMDCGVLFPVSNLLPIPAPGMVGAANSRGYIRG